MIEIERKFILPRNIFESMPQLSTVSRKYLEQGYMFDNGDSVMRVRLTHGGEHAGELRTTGGITIKYSTGSSNLSRPEFEYDIPVFDAIFMMKRCNNRISKTRHYFRRNSALYEIDVYDGIHQGLITAEVEFQTLQEAEKFVPEDFILKEVTEDYRFSNSYMSTRSEKEMKELLKEVYGE